jgi:adenosine/AMP kinase
VFLINTIVILRPVPPEYPVRSKFSRHAQIRKIWQEYLTLTQNSGVPFFLSGNVFISSRNHQWIGISMPGGLTFSSVKIEKPADLNVILGHSHFIKTAEDLYEAVTGAVPGAQFGLAFCEASGDCLIRVEGSDEELKGLAEKNALLIGAGHSFILFLRNCYPINVLPTIKNVQEVCTIYCATANPIEVIVAETPMGRGIMGVIDGSPPRGVESTEDVRKRIDLLRRFGYKRG